MRLYDSWLNDEEFSENSKMFLANEALENIGAIAILDKDFRMVYINDKYAETMGIDKATSLGKSVYDVIDNTNMTNVASTKHPELGVLYRRNNVSFVIHKFPIIKDGEFMGIVGISTLYDSENMVSLKLKLDNLSKELSYYKEKNYRASTAKYGIDNIITKSEAMLNLKKLVHKVASTKSTVLITGESGTGKELFAHSIHALSDRANMPFIRINCSAIPENLIESELFGYEKGSFTGALKEGKIGDFEMANGGTIMMDEIDSLPFSLQSKLLRVLQEKEIKRIGGSKTIDIDVRMIFTTNKDLISMVRNSTFREDLYYRINVINISIPPLRERKEDIPNLVAEFIHKFNKAFGMRVTGITKEAMDLLLSYQWPGNVRELENAIERAFIYATDGMLGVEHFDLQISNHGKEKESYSLNSGQKLKDVISKVEREMIYEALIKTGGNKKKAAERLGIDRSLLYDKIRKYKIKEVYNLG